MGSEFELLVLDMSARELDIFALFMSHMRKNSYEYSLEVNLLRNYLRLNNRAVSSQLNKIIHRLRDRTVNDVRLFQHIDYKNCVLTIIPHAPLTEYKNQFSLIEIKAFVSLKREYSKKLLWLLSVENREFTIDELKRFFCVHNGSSLSDSSVFLTRCIKQSIKELSSNSLARKEISFIGRGFKLRKQGKTITHIKFIYYYAEQEVAVTSASVNHVLGQTSYIQGY